MKSLKGGSRSFRQQIDNNPQQHFGHNREIAHRIINNVTMEQKPSNNWTPNDREIDPQLLFDEISKYDLDEYFYPDFNLFYSVELNDERIRMLFFNLLKNTLKNFEWKYDYSTNQWYHNIYAHKPRRSNRIRRRIQQPRTRPSLSLRSIPILRPGSIPRRSNRIRQRRIPQPRTIPSLRQGSIPSLRPGSIPRRSNRIRRRRISNQHRR